MDAEPDRTEAKPEPRPAVEAHAAVVPDPRVERVEVRLPKPPVSIPLGAEVPAGVPIPRFRACVAVPRADSYRCREGRRGLPPPVPRPGRAAIGGSP